MKSNALLTKGTEMQTSKVLETPEDIREWAISWIEKNTFKDTKPEQVWVDIETSGLDFSNDLFLEIGIIITDAHCRVVPGGVFQSIIHAPNGVNWEDANQYVTSMHLRSNLAKDLEETTSELHDVKVVEANALAFMLKNFGLDLPAMRLPMSGSSVGFDKSWISNRMPELSELFGHRVIDVSSFRESAKLLGRPSVKDEGLWRGFTAHRVVPDMIDSIEEYKFYTGLPSTERN